jgi:hypothetical protein
MESGVLDVAGSVIVSDVVVLVAMVEEEGD